jgi:cellulose synthase/poly-beta-1,6-N-acetylglucosamine synthase-like glycosyltransferase
MWFIGFIFFIYLVTLSVLLFSLVNITNKKVSASISPKRFSILVAFRDEEVHLPALIESLQLLEYPKEQYEIIFINDHSTDASENLVAQFEKASSQVQQLHLKEGLFGKKAALQLAIEQAQFEYIITTDADCIVPKKWLLSYNTYLDTTDSDAVIGSVAIAKPTDFLSRFQYYDFLALQAAGFALANLKRPFLCNGANFCYTKAAYEKVNGFQGNDHLPSGDDVLLLQKFVQHKLEIGYVLQQENLVLTQAISKLRPFIEQRKRWFFKTKSSTLLQKAFGILLLLANLLVLVLLILAIFNHAYFLNLILLLIVKLSIDFFFTFEMAKKLQLPFRYLDFLLANLFYPIGISLFISQLTNSYIQWKQRSYQV